jgi:thioester reductase-like protein
MKKIFITGFPGFIGTRLVRELMKRDSDLEVAALIQQKFLHAAEAARSRISEEIPDSSKRLEFVFGDITQDNLGMSDISPISSQVTGIFHLAAAYDLAVSRTIGMKVNVEGTKNVVEFAKRCKNLKRLDYVSTAYVSGTFVGNFSEDDFERGQKFKNHYEETKFLAEKVIRDARDIPSVIYRPGIVVGDSRTGNISKYDGPYYVLQTMQALPNLFPFPRIGSGKVEVNLVPIDYVINALAALSAENGALNNTYHLTDPTPLKVSELQSMFAKALGKRFINYPFPAALARKTMSLSFVRKIYKMPAQMVDYFVQDVHYESANTTAALKKLGVVCPNFSDYFKNLFSFFQSHKQEELQGILI